MKADARPDRDDEPGRDELSAFLRQWPAPAPPSGVEEALRREFRVRRRRARSLAPWAALAAGLGLVAVGLLVTLQESRRPAATDAAAPEMAATAAPPVVSQDVAPGVEPERERAGEVAAPRVRRAVRAEAPVRRELVIVVEPGQAELLAQLGRQLWERRQAAPGTEVVAMPEAPTPAYRAEWQPLAGVWPQVQQSVSDMGR